jgi:hypothetical protein
MIRSADPYRDTDVIDARAPRVNQAVVAIISIISVVTGWWPLLALYALQMAIGLRFGRRYCLACVLYFEVIQPRLGEGPIEDARPPRFANILGVIFLSAASVAYLVGLPLLGGGLALIVAALAALAATTAICVGCEMYRIAARLRSIQARTLTRIDLTDLAELQAVPEGSFVVQFTHPLCTDCHAQRERLESEGRAVVAVDVRQRPELARKYGIDVVPIAVAVAPGGLVQAHLPV